MYQFNREDYDKRMEWYRQARFGMFIHWGLYAIPAMGGMAAQYGADSQRRVHEVLFMNSIPGTTIPKNGPGRPKMPA